MSRRRDYAPPTDGAPQVGYVPQPPPITNQTYSKQELVQMLDSALMCLARQSS